MKSKNSAKILGLAALIAVGIAVAAEVAQQSALCTTWRYKLTVNVNTPEGLKSGSAVREAQICMVDHLAPEMSDTDVKPKGEAVVVDLDRRGVLFVLTSFDDYQILWSVFPGPLGFTEEGFRYYGNLKAKTILKPEQYPMIVTFTDLNDPKTVKLVKGGVFDVKKQEHTPADNLESIFGSDVKLKDVVIEMSDEPVTWGIEKWLPWLFENNGGYLDGQFSGGGPELSNILHGGNFKNGDEK